MQVKLSHSLSLVVVSEFVFKHYLICSVSQLNKLNYVINSWLGYPLAYLWIVVKFLLDSVFLLMMWIVLIWLFAIFLFHPVFTFFNINKKDILFRSIYFEIMQSLRLKAPIFLFRILTLFHRVAVKFHFNQSISSRDISLPSSILFTWCATCFYRPVVWHTSQIVRVWKMVWLH